MQKGATIVNMQIDKFKICFRAIPIIGGNALIEGSDPAILPRRSHISLSMLNLLENSEGSRRSTDILSETSSVDRLHSRQASQEATHSVEDLTGQLDELYAKVITGLLV